MSSIFIILSRYFLNIICFTIFSVVPLTYFGVFPYTNKSILLYFYIYHPFSNLSSIPFIAFNISSINIYVFLYSMLFDFYNSFFQNFFSNICIVIPKKYVITVL